MVEKQEKQVEKEDQDIIWIGGKPFMNYVTGVVMKFTTKGAKQVIIRSRGRYNARAIDVAEVATKKFLADIAVKIKDVKIDSEELTVSRGKDNKKLRVSTIDIILSR